MHILVTGGAGFLGSNLCKRLLSQGHSIECVDNLLTGRRSNIAEFESDARFCFIEHDITAGYKPMHKPDQIYNLACPASPRWYQATPIATTLTNVVGMRNMLELARVHDATILQASTSEVYGDPEIHPQPESYHGNVNPIGIRSCYDEGKRVAESLCFDYLRTHATRIKVARIFNTYGPRMAQDDGRAISSFIVAALRHNPLVLYGNGNQTRSFCYVDDLIDALVLLMNSSRETTGPVNLGSQYEYAIRDVAELIRELTRSSSVLEYQPIPEDDPRIRKPDISRARTELGWYPTTSLETGLEKTIKYFHTMLDESENCE